MEIILPTCCRVCEKDFSGIENYKKGVFRIPSKNQWFQSSNITQESIDHVDIKQIVFYCPECYIELQFKSVYKLNCCHCGIAEEGVSLIPMVSKDSQTVYYGLGMELELLMPIKEASFKSGYRQLCTVCLKKLTNISTEFNSIPKRPAIWNYKNQCFMFNLAQNYENGSTYDEDSDSNSENESSELNLKNVKSPKVTFDYSPNSCIICNQPGSQSIIKEGAKVISKTYFSTQTGVYKNNSHKFPKIIQYPSIICGDCLVNIKSEKVGDILCHHCQNKYPNIIKGEKNGEYCTSYITENSITCGYGSKYDLISFTWTQGIIPDSLYKIYRINPDCNVCDFCINNFIRTNEIQFSQEY